MDMFTLAVYLSTAVLLIGSMAVVSYAVIRGFRQRDLMLAVSAVIFLMGLTLRLPVQEPDVSLLERVALAAVDGLRYFTMDIAYEPAAIEGNALLASWYRQLDVILNFVAPLCTTMILLSVLQMLGWVRFRLCFWRPVYCFSELNERSFALAKSVMDDWGTREGDFFKPVLVFFKTEPHDDSVELQYRAEAQRLGAAFYREPIHAVRLPNPWYRRVKVFLIDQDEDSNMGTATRMKDWICPDRKRGLFGQYTDSDLLVFSTRESSEVVFDKLLEELERRRKNLYKEITEEKEKSTDAVAARDLSAAEPKENSGEEVKAADAVSQDAPAAEPKKNSEEAAETTDAAAAQDAPAAEPKKNGEKEQKTVDARIDLHLVNETKLIAQKLLWEHPLYEALEAPEGGEISMLLVGGGRLGMEILRTALVCGVMDKCTFRITVIDAKGNEIEAQFDHTYGQLPNGIRDNIRFRQADVYSTDFDQLLDAPELEPNYIVVATGDDERNVTTAQFLQRYYARRDIRKGKLIKKLRRVHVAIRDQGRYEALEALRSDGLDLFGCHAEIFCRKMLLDRPIDRVAMMFHSAYEDKTVTHEMLLPRTYSKFRWWLHRLLNFWTPENRKAKHKYYTLSAVDLHSNQMVVLHSIYKFRDLLYMSGKLREYTAIVNRDGDPAEAFAVLVAAMHKHQQTLYPLEHRRWEVFQTLDGWQPFEECRIKQYAAHKDQKLPGLDMHKHKTARLHGCLTPYEKLEHLAEQVNTWYKPDSPKEFLEYDRKMCVNSLFAWLELVAKGNGVDALRNRVRKIISHVAKKDRETAAAGEDQGSYTVRLLDAMKAEFVKSEETKENAPVA